MNSTETTIVTISQTLHDGTVTRATIEWSGVGFGDAIEAIRGALLGIGFQPKTVERHLGNIGETTFKEDE